MFWMEKNEVLTDHNCFHTFDTTGDNPQIWHMIHKGVVKWSSAVFATGALGCSETTSPFRHALLAILRNSGP